MTRRLLGKLCVRKLGENDMNEKKIKMILAVAFSCCAVLVAVFVIIKLSNIPDTDATGTGVKVETGETEAGTDDVKVETGDVKTGTDDVKVETGDVKTGTDDVTTGTGVVNVRRVQSGPPNMTVTNLDESITESPGTCSWTIPHGDGKFSLIEGDADHPLFSKEYMEPLEMKPTVFSSVDPLRAVLQWDHMPSTVSVKCWGEEDWENFDAIPNGVSVEAKRVDKELYGDIDAFEIKLMDGNYIYEVHAYFPNSGSGYGDAYYGFYTEKFPQSP